MKTLLKILMVEHNAADIELIQNELKTAGINFISEIVQSDPEYRNAIQTFVPDLILSDYSLPSFDGPEAFNIREQMSPDTPFIFVSGSIGEEKSIEYIKNGVTDYVNKESLFTLETKVKRALKDAEEKQQKKNTNRALIKANRLYGFISQINQNIVRIKEEKTLFHNACRIAYLYGKFKMAWIGKFGNDFKKITLLEQYGIAKDDVHLFTDAPIQINSPQDHVVHTGTNYVCNDIQHDFKLLNWKPFATSNDIQSCMVLPIKKYGQLIGTFNLYSSEPGFFDADEIKLLEEVTGDICFAIDLLENVKRHKEAEGLIFESENRFRAIIEKSSELITLSDKEGKISYLTPSITKVFGYTLEDINNMSYYNFIHPDDTGEFIEKRQKILETNGAFFTIQLRLLHKNGTWIWCDTKLTNMLIEPGVNAMVSNFRNISEIKIAEQQMEFDKNNLNALINNTHDLLWSVDKNLILITFNQPFYKMIEYMFGVSLVKGDNTQTIPFPQKQLEKYTTFYERAFAGEIFTEIEYTDSPEEFWSEISFYPISKGNQIVGTACHSRNITERKKAERELIQSEKKYRHILETAQEGIWLIDENNNTTFVNDKMCEILEYPCEEIMGHTHLSFKNEHDQLIGLKHIEKRKKGAKETFETRFSTKNGRSIWAQVSASPIFNDYGIYTGTLSMITDISKRKQEEQQLKLLESVITNTNDSVVITEAEPQDEPNPKIIYVNEAFTKMTGYTAAEVIGKSPRILQGPKSDKKELQRMGECLRKWESCEVTTINYKKNGEEFWINFSVTPVANEKGWYTHWIAIERDVTEEKIREHKILKAIIKTQEDERYEIGGELHDNVCQLLATSQITLCMIKEFVAEERMGFYTQGREYITMALDEIRKLSHRLAPAFFDNSTLEQAFERLLESFNVNETFKIVLQFDKAIKDYPINQDIQLNLYRILQEQFKNILKYSEATLIKVDVLLNDNLLTMIIFDNGIGFNVDAVKNGIGIANMKRRAELFSGKLEITSSPGNGCVVKIDIPLT